MSYTIITNLLPLGRNYNRPGIPLNPSGIVIHDTDDAGATAQNERNYFGSGYRGASAHVFADWNDIILCIPDNEEAWHAGSIANSRYLSIEMCVPSGNNFSQFQEVWNRIVWYVATKCVQYGWNTNDNVFSHRGISAIYHQTDHIDPIPFLESYGKSWEQLLSAIDIKINELKTPNPKPQPINNNGGNDMLEVAVLLFSKEDYWSGYDVAVKNGNCGIFTRPADHSVPKDAWNSKKLIVIGGSTTKHPGELLLSGNTKYDTAAEVAKYLG